MAKFLLNDFMIKDHIVSALKEDVGYGDISTDFICADIDKNKRFEIFLRTREEGILCGCDPFRLVFEILAKDDVKIEFYKEDGDKITPDEPVAKIVGYPRYVLTGERLALNYIQRMSGIATFTKKFQDIAEPYGARVVDTRKNTPNFRLFEKYAVKVGGGHLHRFNLCDCVMLKDNHIALMGGSIEEAVKKVRSNISHAHKIEVECDTFEQVQKCLNAGADIIMLDNMSIDEIKKCISLINKKAIVEVSGNVNLKNLEEIAKTGVDIISTSAIVAKAPTLDLGFDYIG
ncbi:MAG: carboxylating nicotinate-nucleotide diphosphorylase [Candidatus Gastranaerophilales bacterium]|nr:carboxylating nicotinate-nucleotide diphosphorylase [Candidatus Gastranaerophilales bacterium]